MDKYETGLKIQEIERLYHADKYKAAAELAKEIDWPRIKAWEPLAMMIDIYEHLDDDEEARDMAILAYNRNLGGKRLLFRLTDLFIKTGDISNAKELFKEYCVSAKTSTDKYILQYHLLRAQKAPDSELIRALENYRDKEVDERYLYRLAQLYAKTGAPEKCVSICDDIYSMFRDGDYVEGAIKLKKRVGGKLSEEQNRILHKSRVREEELSRTAQLTFADQLRLSRKVKEIEAEAGFVPLSIPEEKSDAVKAVAAATSALENTNKDTSTEKVASGAFEHIGNNSGNERSAEVDDTIDSVFKEKVLAGSEKGPAIDYDTEEIADVIKATSDMEPKDDNVDEYEEALQRSLKFDIDDDLQELEGFQPAPVKMSDVHQVSAEQSSEKEVKADDILKDIMGEDREEAVSYGSKDGPEELRGSEREKKGFFGFIRKTFGSDEFDYDKDFDDEDFIPELRPKRDPETAISTESKENKNIGTETEEKKPDTDYKDDVTDEEVEEMYIEDESDMAEEELSEDTGKTISAYEPENLSDNLKGLISAAKQKIDSDYDKMVRFGQVARKNLEVRDAMEKNPTAASVREILEQEKALGGFSDEEEQVEGQLSMSDWMNEVREQKYGKQDTKEYSKTELERLLDEKDEKSLAYDKLMEEQRRLAREAGTPFNEAVAKQKVEGQMMVNAAKTDLAIRTGKATEKLENEIPAVGHTKTAEEKLLDAMADAVRPADKNAPVNADIFTDRLKELGDVPAEVASAAAMLMNFLSGKYVPAPEEESKDTVVLKPRHVSDDFKNERVSAPSVKAATPEWEPVPDDAFEEEPVTKRKDSIEDDIASADEEIFGRPGFITSKLRTDDIIPDLAQDDSFAASETEEKLDLVADDDVKLVEQELIQPDPVSQVEVVNKENGYVHDTNDYIDDDFEIAPEEMRELLEEEEDDGKFIDEPNQTTANIKEMLENDKFFSDISPEELEDILSMDAAEKKKNIDAVDKITARITGVYDKPLVTPEMLAAMGINEDDNISVPEHQPGMYDTAGIDKQMLRDIIDSRPEEEEIVEDLDSIGDKYSKTGMHDPEIFEEALAAALPAGKHQKVIDMFDEFYDMPNIDEQIEKWIACLPREMNRNDSVVGNIAISGEDADVNVNLAKSIARAVNAIYPEFKKKLARISVESVNAGGFLKAIVKFRGSALLIEDAGDIRPDVAVEIASALNSETKRMILILEDSAERLNNLFMVNPELGNAFNHKITLRHYSVEELVEVAKEFAARRDFRIGSEACEKIAADIMAFKKKEPVISLDDMNEFVDQAIRHASKRLKKERKKDPSVGNILVPVDFK